MLYLRQKNYAKALYLPQEFNQRITLWTKARQKKHAKYTWDSLSYLDLFH